MHWEILAIVLCLLLVGLTIVWLRRASPPVPTRTYRCVDGRCEPTPDGDPPGEFRKADCSDGAGAAGVNNCSQPSGFSRLRANDIFRCDEYDCLEVKPSFEPVLAQTRYMKNTEELVKNIANEFSIGGAVPVAGLLLSATLGAITGVDTTRKTEVQTAYREYMMISGTVTLKREARCNAKRSKLLDPHMIKDFALLPLVVLNPWEKTSWRDYNLFLRKYGTHIVTQIVYGSRYIWFESAESQSSELKKTLEIKACVGASSLAEGCDKFSKEEMKNAMEENTESHKIVMGGSAATKRSLSMAKSDSSKEFMRTVNAFLDAGRNSNEPIMMKFTEIWEFIYRHTNTDDVVKKAETRQRCMNLEAAFAFDLFDCDRAEAGSPGTVYQEFRARNVDGLSVYSCWNRKFGCTDSEDCEYTAFVGCRASGRSAFDAGETISGKVKTGIRRKPVGKSGDDINGSCVFSGLSCHCNSAWNKGEQDRDIWSSDFAG